MSSILAVGSASVEEVLHVKNDLKLGGKYTAAARIVGVGGSGVNYTCRLLAMGQAVYPLLVVGEDPGGDAVVAEIRRSATRGHATCHDIQRVPDATTARTIIMLDRFGRRTTITVPGHKLESFGNVVSAALTRTLGHPIDAVMIGHIPTDHDGDVTRLILRRFIGEMGNVYILFNPGRTQYTLGKGGFPKLLERVDCIQFHVDEAREFLASGGQYPGRLHFGEMLDALADLCQSAVITFGRLGAVGKKRGAQGGVLAYPYDVDENILDTTGAGDAFAAGVVASMTSDANQNRDLRVAMTEGRLWATYACMKYCGARECPTPMDLKLFERRHQAMQIGEVEELEAKEFYRLLRLLERTVD